MLIYKFYFINKILISIIKNIKFWFECVWNFTFFIKIIFLIINKLSPFFRLIKIENYNNLFEIPKLKYRWFNIHIKSFNSMTSQKLYTGVLYFQ